MLGQNYYSYIILLLKVLIVQIVFANLLGQMQILESSSSDLVAHFMPSAVVAVCLSYV